MTNAEISNIINSAVENLSVMSLSADEVQGFYDSIIESSLSRLTNDYSLTNEGMDELYAQVKEVADKDFQNEGVAQDIAEAIREQAIFYDFGELE